MATRIPQDATPEDLADYETAGGKGFSLPQSDGGPGIPNGRKVRKSPPVLTAYELSGRRFAQTASGVSTYDMDGKPYEILTGMLDVSRISDLRDLTAEREPAKNLEDTIWQIEYAMSQDSPPNIYQMMVSDRDSRDRTYLDHAGIRPYVYEGRIKSVGQALTAIAYRARLSGRTGMSAVCSGPMKLPDGSWIFLRYGKPALTATGVDDSYSVHYTDGIDSEDRLTILDFDDPSAPEQRAEDFANYLRIIDLYRGQSGIGYAIIGALAWAPYSAIRRFGRIVVALYGESGFRKTAGAAITILAQSSYALGGKIEPPVAINMRDAQSTRFGIDKALYPLSGTLAIVDDFFADQLKPYEVGEQWRRLSGIVNNSVTGSGGTRGGGSGRKRWSDLSKQSYPRCSIIITAERLPNIENHSSTVGRMTVFEVTDHANLDVLTELQAIPRSLSRAHAAMIQDSLPDLSRPDEALAYGIDVAEGWRLDGHARQPYTYSRLLAGNWLVARQARDTLGWGDSQVSAYLDDAEKSLRLAAETQARKSSIRGGRDMSRDAVRLFCQAFRELCGSGKMWYAAGRNDGHYIAPNLPGYSPHAAGWRESGQGWMPPPGANEPIGMSKLSEQGRPAKFPVALWMKSSDFPRAYNLINEYVMNNSGWSLPPIDDMRARLGGAGIIQRNKKGKDYESDHIFGIKVQAMKLDLPRLRGDDIEPGPEDGPGEPESESGSPEPSGPAPLIPEPERPAQGSGSTDPESHAPGMPKAQPGPCRRCGRSYEYGKAGNLCPDCLAKESGHMIAALGVDGLYFPGVTQPKLCDMPRNLSEVYALAMAWGIRQLWIHPATARKMKLPRELPIDIPIGSGSPHKWAELPEGMASDPAGLAPWITVWDMEKGRKASQRYVILPTYETRAPWNTAKTPAILADAVAMLNEALPGDWGYYYSPKFTVQSMARRVCRSLHACQAVINHEIPAMDGYKSILARDWRREDEGNAAGVLRIDRNKAELSGMNTPLGVGEPVHMAGPVEFNRKLAGYYRLAAQPGPYDPEMPPLDIEPGSDGGLWVTRARAELLLDLGLLPEISEAYVWPESKRVLYPLYDRIRKATEYLYERRDTPAGMLAWDALKDCWRPVIGDLAKTRGPSGPDDRLYRPDIRHALKDETYCRMYRNLIRARQVSGRAPIGTRVDAADYLANGPDDLPEGLTYDSLRGGAWKLEKFMTVKEWRRDG